VLAPELRQLGVVELADRGAGDVDVTARGLVEAGENVHQCRLAGARGAHHCRQLAACDLDGDAAERVHGGLTAAVVAGEVMSGDDGRRLEWAGAVLMAGLGGAWLGG
jgi:hypothetical protein